MRLCSIGESMKHGNKGKITGFARPDNWLNKRRKEAKKDV